MAKRKKRSDFEVLITFIITLIILLITIIIKILLFAYDVITIYTSKYSIKSGNGFFKTFFDKGNFGEFKLYRKIIRKFGKDNVFTNVYLDNNNTDHTEIDLIALSVHGIYILEMKNYSGYIYGSEKDQYWTQVLNRNTKNKFYNPLRQNYVHTKALENYLELNDNETIPIVVFANHSKLKKINVGNKKGIVKINEVNRLINNNFKNKEVIFSESKLIDFSVKLIERSNMSQEIKNKHIEQVHKIQEES